jgi:hypothetical protein
MKRIAYVLKPGETEVPPGIQHAFDQGRRVREVIRKNIKPGLTAAETLEILNQRIAEAGVPVLVIALWDESFSNKVRRGLQQLSADSGGRLFQVLGVEQLDGAVDRYGPVLDSGVALRFQPPQRSKPGPAQVSVKAGDRSIEVTAPKTIR